MRHPLDTKLPGYREDQVPLVRYVLLCEEYDHTGAYVETEVVASAPVPPILTMLLNKMVSEHREGGAFRVVVKHDHVLMHDDELGSHYSLAIHRSVSYEGAEA